MNWTGMILEVEAAALEVEAAADDGDGDLSTEKACLITI